MLCREPLIDDSLRRNFHPEVIRPLVALGASLYILVGIPYRAYSITKHYTKLEEAIKTGKVANNPKIMGEIRREIEGLYGSGAASEIMRRIEENHTPANK